MCCSERSAGALIGHLRVRWNAPFAMVEACECVWESVVGEGHHLGCAGLIDKLLHFLFADAELAETSLDSLHSEREEYQEHWKKHHGKTLHTEQ